MRNRSASAVKRNRPAKVTTAADETDAAHDVVDDDDASGVSGST